jgi:translation initiation factor IF-3
MTKQMRMNQKIRVPEVRVVFGSEMLGIMPTLQALRRAREEGLDLVEVDARAVPPVCKILDAGKLRYEERKMKSRANRRPVAVVKLIELRPKTHDHDLAFKMRAARRLLVEGHSVRISVRYRGRERTHPEKAREQLDVVVPALADVAQIVQPITSDARSMSVLLGPRKT